jgi:hypothetical protein
MQQNYNQMAQGLASLGRGDDSMLMHITPDEFQDFNRMAQSAGMEHIPINPMTGLPEFGFGKFVKKVTKSVSKVVSKVVKSPIVKTLLPIAIGMYAPGFLASMGAPAWMSSAGGIGALTGGATWALTGDPMAGLSAGIGAYGGANLGTTLSNYGKIGTNAAANAAPTQFGVSSIANPMAAATPIPTVTSALSSTAAGGFGDINTGIGNLFSDVTGGDFSTAWDQLKTASGETVKVPGTEATGRTVAFENPDGTASLYNPAKAATEATTAWQPGTGMDAAWTVGAPAYQVAMAAMAPDPEDIEDQLTDEEIDLLEGTNYDPTRRLDLSGESKLRLYDYSAENPGLDLSVPEGGLDLIDEEETGITYAAQGGLMRLANGGYLSGGNVPGDGMSDDIPARIGGAQEAALSEGEFVIPADVVSHLGNGSSNAGSKKLYAMMDNLRKDRTGTKQQGREINPYNYIPA